MEWIISHQANFRQAALDEVAEASGGLGDHRELSEEITWVSTARYPGNRWRPVFVRHRFLVEAKAPWPDIKADIATLGKKLKKNRTYSIQLRSLEDAPVLAKEAEAELQELLQGAAAFDRRKPYLILSVVLGAETAYAGIARPEENLSRWSGGCHHLAKKDDQVSRAEFKLQEALETFSLRPKRGQRALDLGAAPGGWSRILSQMGLKVTAVDPADLDPQVSVLHQKMTAQQYSGEKGIPFHWLVNDMKMDAVESAQIVNAFYDRVTLKATVLMTLKLPEMGGLEKMSEALTVLDRHYRLQGLKQLFHNRNEVTAWLEPRKREDIDKQRSV